MKSRHFGISRLRQRVNVISLLSLGILLGCDSDGSDPAPPVTTEDLTVAIAATNGSGRPIEGSLEVQMSVTTAAGNTTDGRYAIVLGPVSIANSK